MLELSWLEFWGLCRSCWGSCDVKQPFFLFPQNSRGPSLSWRELVRSGQYGELGAAGNNKMALNEFSNAQSVVRSLKFSKLLHRTVTCHLALYSDCSLKGAAVSVFSSEFQHCAFLRNPALYFCSSPMPHQPMRRSPLDHPHHLTHPKEE